MLAIQASLSGVKGMKRGWVGPGRERRGPGQPHDKTCNPKDSPSRGTNKIWRSLGGLRECSSPGCPLVPIYYPLASVLRWTGIRRNLLKASQSALGMPPSSGHFAKNLVVMRAGDRLLEKGWAAGQQSGVWIVQGFVEDRTALWGTDKERFLLTILTIPLNTSREPVSPRAHYLQHVKNACC